MTPGVTTFEGMAATRHAEEIVQRVRSPQGLQAHSDLSGSFRAVDRPQVPIREADALKASICVSHLQAAAPLFIINQTGKRPPSP
ncbi:hypothetical protein Sru01_50540 [Sphaerisporangium rufum]|uniref:Uncharacterized protein n=1 Tax=Sphaerisporangium rufum TaxID=1381558 RepID=A0A919R5I0_9ACTN|nr:hypothetical protein Sru01_50540 [Sphaerisporangium rufum]